jgi:hypothetical protein
MTVANDSTECAAGAIQWWRREKRIVVPMIRYSNAMRGMPLIFEAALHSSTRRP